MKIRETALAPHASAPKTRFSRWFAPSILAAGLALGAAGGCRKEIQAEPPTPADVREFEGYRKAAEEARRAGKEEEARRVEKVWANRCIARLGEEISEAREKARENVPPTSILWIPTGIALATAISALIVTYLDRKDRKKDDAGNKK
ncbi:MAG: hypothetical protein AB1657_04005 [Candidatus Micrarchaeota archaeon]